jgi:DNA mismatch endonuclease, patch repair protein
MDIFTAKKRSEIMSKIRSRATGPEEALFQTLKKILGKRKVERNVRALPGQPDFVIPSLQLAIFVDGCFYHGCPEHGHRPKSNRKYWLPKLARNQSRDKSNRRTLRRMGFAVWRIWEHSLKANRLGPTRETLTRKLKTSIAAPRTPLRAGHPALNHYHHV